MYVEDETDIHDDFEMRNLLAQSVFSRGGLKIIDEELIVEPF